MQVKASHLIGSIFLIVTILSFTSTPAYGVFIPINTMFAYTPEDWAVNESCYTIPLILERNHIVPLGNNSIWVGTSPYLFFDPKHKVQNIFIFVFFHWKMKEYSHGFYATAVRVLVGVKFLDATTGKYVPESVLAKHTVDTTAYEPTVSGDLRVSGYSSIENGYYTWNWKGFMMFGHWVNGPHVGTVQYNFTWPWWLYHVFHPSGYISGLGHLWVVINTPPEFLFRNHTGRILIYVLIELEWRSGSDIVRDGIGFILGDNCTLHSTMTLHGYDSEGHPLDFVNSYSGNDSCIYFVPKSP